MIKSVYLVCNSMRKNPTKKLNYNTNYKLCWFGYISECLSIKMECLHIIIN